MFTIGGPPGHTGTVVLISTIMPRHRRLYELQYLEVFTFLEDEALPGS